MANFGFPFVLMMFGLLAAKKDLTTRASTRARPRTRQRRTSTTTTTTTPTTTAEPVPVVHTEPKALPAPTPTATAPAPVSVTTPAPWPQVVPSGLPPFPGSGWTPDEPPGAGVVARAGQLLPELWKHGEGTFKTEQTGGRWITYRATKMGAKKGVVAYKLKSQPSVRAAVEPPVTVQVPISTPPSHAVPPTLRQGSRGADVVRLQNMLGIKPDGIFGGGTKGAVIVYQRAHGLTPDGVVGRRTWQALLGIPA
jgi:peptidoglycan hydrolase-like protein with peptidoglycan-binding domain